MERKFLCSETECSSFSTLYNIENYLRLVLRWELSGQHGKIWTNKIPKEATEEAEKRKKQEKEIGYLDTIEGVLLSYLNLSELKDLILDLIWDYACKGKGHWPPKDVVRGEFKKLIAIRNKTTHFRPLTNRDVRVLKRFSEDLVDWSRHYRRQREYSDKLSKENPKIKDSIIKVLPNLAQSLKTWFDDADPSISLLVNFYPAHIGYTISLADKSFDKGTFKEILDQNKKVIAFCRVGNLANELTFYAPRNIPDDWHCNFLKEIINLSNHSIDLISSDTVKKDYFLAEYECVLPWEIELPIEFSV